MSRHLRGPLSIKVSLDACLINGSNFHKNIERAVVHEKPLSINISKRHDYVETTKSFIRLTKKWRPADSLDSSADLIFLVVVSIPIGSPVFWWKSCAKAAPTAVLIVEMEERGVAGGFRPSRGPPMATGSSTSSIQS